MPLTMTVALALDLAVRTLRWLCRPLRSVVGEGYYLVPGDYHLHVAEDASVAVGVAGRGQDVDCGELFTAIQSMFLRPKRRYSVTSKAKAVVASAVFAHMPAVDKNFDDELRRNILRRHACRPMTKVTSTSLI